MLFLFIAEVTQLGECTAEDRDVEGSSPSRGTSVKIISLKKLNIIIIVKRVSPVMFSRCFLLSVGMSLGKLAL